MENYKQDHPMKKISKIFLFPIWIIILLFVPKISYADVVQLDGFSVNIDKLLGINDIHIGDSWDIVEKNCDYSTPPFEIDNGKFGDLDCYGRFTQIYAINNKIVFIWFSLGGLDENQFQGLLETMSKVHNDYNVLKPDAYTYVLKNYQIAVQDFEGDFMLAYSSEQYAEELQSAYNTK